MSDELCQPLLKHLGGEGRQRIFMYKKLGELKTKISLFLLQQKQRFNKVCVGGSPGVFSSNDSSGVIEEIPALKVCEYEIMCKSRAEQ